MSEELSQPNLEKNEPKRFLIPADGQIVYGFVTGAKERRTTSPQRNGPHLQHREVEVEYEIAGPAGETITQRKMITDYILTDAAQDELIQEYKNTFNSPEGETI
jgi:hypothetical protein